MLVINFKTYKLGDDAIELGRLIEKKHPKAIVCVSSVDLEMFHQKTHLEVFAQHVDLIKGRRGTGYVTPESIKNSGASGTLLNHFEHQVPYWHIKKAVKRCKALGLKTIVCVKNLKETKKVMKLKPYAIAFEAPSLIETGKSITDYKRSEVIAFSKLFEKSSIIPICGAGIHSVDDYLHSRWLGCEGALVASGVAKVRNPSKFLSLTWKHTKKPKKIVFVDRDGTLIGDNKLYLGHQENWKKKLKLLPGVAEGIKELNSRKDTAVYLITNQPGVAVKDFPHLTEDRAKEVSVEVMEMLSKKGAYIDNFRVCGHAPKKYRERRTEFKYIKKYTKECSCFKPKTGMLKSLMKERCVKFSKVNVYTIGDRASDTLTATKLKGHGILVPYKYSPNQEEKVRNLKNKNILIEKSFDKAVKRIIKLENGNNK